MALRSAGIFLHRRRYGKVEVLLVHPGGPFWRNKDIGAWQIPKGLVEPGEHDELAARREVAEELGCMVTGPLSPLGKIRQAGGKTVIAFATEQDFDPTSLVSNMIEIEWPARSGRKLAIPEVDEARWFDLTAAKKHILASQAILIDRLSDMMVRER